MAMQDEQRLKDLLRNIETGDIPEDLPDPEDYDDMGGIKSLDRGAPSIKMASETGEEEFGLELDSLYYEFLDAVKKGYGGSFEDYAKDYFSKKQTKDADRKMAMFGGRMQYADGNPGAMGNPAVVGPKMSGEEMREFMIMNPGIEDVADYEGYYKKLKAMKEEKPVMKKEGVSKPKIDLTPSVVEKLKKLLKKREEEAKKLAKGGIAGVL